MVITIPWSLVNALTFSFHNSGRAGQSDVPGEGSELPDSLAPFHQEGRCFSAQYSCTSAGLGERNDEMMAVKLMD